LIVSSQRKGDYYDTNWRSIEPVGSTNGCCLCVEIEISHNRRPSFACDTWLAKTSSGEYHPIICLQLRGGYYYTNWRSIEPFGSTNGCCLCVEIEISHHRRPSFACDTCLAKTSSEGDDHPIIWSQRMGGYHDTNWRSIDLVGSTNGCCLCMEIVISHHRRPSVACDTCLAKTNSGDDHPIIWSQRRGGYDDTNRRSIEPVGSTNGCCLCVEIEISHHRRPSVAFNTCLAKTIS
jgi:hypothetical protein